VITPPAVKRFGPNRWLVGLVVGVGGVVLVCGLPFNKMLLLVATFLINVASQSMKIIVDATIQHECDDVYRGRIFSVNDTAFNFCFVLGLFITATAFPANGRSVVGLFSVAIAFVAIALWFAIGSRRPSDAVPALPPPG
jgi:predicted MFS family arabinose efflux permease